MLDPASNESAVKVAPAMEVPVFAPWVYTIWNDETVEFLESRVFEAKGQDLSRNLNYKVREKTDDPERIQRLAYLAEAAVEALARKQGEEGLRPQLSKMGSIPLAVANRWLMNFLELNRDQLLDEVLAGELRSESGSSLVEDSYCLLIETTDFTAPQWKQVEEMLFSPGWLDLFAEDEQHKHNAWYLRKHFLPNPSMPVGLMERLLDEMIQFRRKNGNTESLNLGVGWFLTNTNLSVENLVRMASRFIEADRIRENETDGIREDEVNVIASWEWFCGHPNWSPELADLISFHVAEGCGRDNHRLYTGCYAKGASPCSRKQRAAEEEIPITFSAVASFIEAREENRFHTRSNYEAQEFTFCPHDHPWDDLVKEVAMSSWRTATSTPLPRPKVMIDVLPGYALGRSLLAEMSSQLGNPEVPSEWLQELL